MRALVLLLGLATPILASAEAQPAPAEDAATFCARRTGRPAQDRVAVKCRALAQAAVDAAAGKRLEEALENLRALDAALRSSTARRATRQMMDPFPQ